MRLNGWQFHYINFFCFSIWFFNFILVGTVFNVESVPTYFYQQAEVVVEKWYFEELKQYKGLNHIIHQKWFSQTNIWEQQWLKELILEDNKVYGPIIDIISIS